MDYAGPTAVVARRGRDRDAIRQSVLEHLVYEVGKDPEHAVPRDWCVALSLAVRDRIVDDWIPTTRAVYRRDQKRVYYLSMEFLVGRLLGDAIGHLGLEDECRAVLSELGADYDAALATEPDPALGNGGLGRLAACFLDSMARLGIAAYGYGIRYQHGLFKQGFEDGWQVEEADDWLTVGNPWEFERPEVVYSIGFGGTVVTAADGRATWQPTEEVLAAAYDTPIAGRRGQHANTLRLWAAKPQTVFDLDAFNRGHFMAAAERQVLAETLSRVLYPNDTTPAGQELRLKQEYFFTAASLADLVRRFRATHDDLAALPRHAAIQLNDTHPAVAVPELMRLLIDEHGVDFDTAFEIARGCLSYTNHTLLPEALERWPLELFARVLPRHLQLIAEIDRRAAAELDASGTGVDVDAVRVVDDTHVRMGNLAFVGCHKVNGVSALHTELMRETVFAGLNRVYPDRIVNQTNGITPRRWLADCNPGLAALLRDTIGDAWELDLEQLEALVPHADDAAFRARFAAVKRANKGRLAGEIARACDLTVDPDALFDVHVKRLHEYKRQLLNVLEAVAHYNAIRREPDRDWQPRVKVFAGKAAPGYVTAKLIIKLANDVARVVNNDPVVGDRLKIAFPPNYGVSLAEIIIPAADLSEQVSTAGMEASGTGNMKLALNGALTVGTLDGANVEIRDCVGAENIFIFGLTAQEVAAKRAAGYDPGDAIAASPALKEALDMIAAGAFSPDDPDRFHPLVNDLRGHDYFMVAADFDAYVAIQRTIDGAFGDHDDWVRRAVLNTARVGWFSSDRTIRGYARDIWHVPVDGA